MYTCISNYTAYILHTPCITSPPRLGDADEPKALARWGVQGWISFEHFHSSIHTHSRASTPRASASLIEEDGHVFGVLVDQVAVVELGKERGHHRRALRLGQLAGPESARGLRLRATCAKITQLLRRLRILLCRIIFLMESIARVIEWCLSVEAVMSTDIAMEPDMLTFIALTLRNEIRFELSYLPYGCECAFIKPNGGLSLHRLHSAVTLRIVFRLARWGRAGGRGAAYGSRR